MDEAPLTDAERGAVKRFADALASRPLSSIPDAQIASLPGLADRLTALLLRGDVSPSGTRASAVQDASARYALGFTAQAGGKGAEAAYWYALAARVGDTRGFTQLGLLMLKGGAGVPADPPSTAVLWWIAALRGASTASYDLGAMYENGVGMPPDPHLALQWFTLAADQGNKEARAAIKRLSKR